MKYSPYPNYKDSGVEWIGSIPHDWEMWKIAHACSYIASGTTPSSNSDEYYGGDTLWVTTGELRENVIFDTTKKVSTEALSKYSTLKIHPAGSVAIAMYGATIGRLGILGVEATTNQACCVMPPSDKLFNKYLFYWLLAMRQEIINLSSGGGQPNVNQEKIASLKVSAPCFEEQKQIAAFLDRETEKIDTLIAEQERLIGLLGEKRQAVISHAVTKGLDPAVAMKDSGLSWAPIVPAHWSLTQNRSLIRIRRVVVGQRHSEYQLLSLTKQGVIVRDLSTGEGKHSDYLDRTQEVRPGDLVFCLFDVEETPRTIGLSSHLGMISGDYTIFECSDELAARFLEYFYKAMDDRKLLKPLYRGLRKRIPKPKFLRIRTPMPPPEEQLLIVEYLDNFQMKVTQLTEAALKQIELLKERRTALISAAVTGKIDVRHL